MMLGLLGLSTNHAQQAAQNGVESFGPSPAIRAKYRYAFDNPTTRWEREQSHAHQISPQDEAIAVAAVEHVKYAGDYINGPAIGLPKVVDPVQYGRDAWLLDSSTRHEDS